MFRYLDKYLVSVDELSTMSPGPIWTEAFVTFIGHSSLQTSKTFSREKQSEEPFKGIGLRQLWEFPSKESNFVLPRDVLCTCFEMLNTRTNRFVKR